MIKYKNIGGFFPNKPLETITPELKNLEIIYDNDFSFTSTEDYIGIANINDDLIKNTSFINKNKYFEKLISKMVPLDLLSNIDFSDIKKIIDKKLSESKNNLVIIDKLGKIIYQTNKDSVTEISYFFMDDDNNIYDLRKDNTKLLLEICNYELIAKIDSLINEGIITPEQEILIKKSISDNEKFILFNKDNSILIKNDKTNNYLFDEEGSQLYYLSEDIKFEYNKRKSKHEELIKEQINKINDSISKIEGDNIILNKDMSNINEVEKYYTEKKIKNIIGLITSLKNLISKKLPEWEEYIKLIDQELIKNTSDLRELEQKTISDKKEKDSVEKRIKYLKQYIENKEFIYINNNNLFKFNNSDNKLTPINITKDNLKSFETESITNKEIEIIKKDYSNDNLVIINKKNKKIIYNQEIENKELKYYLLDTSNNIIPLIIGKNIQKYKNYNSELITDNNTLYMCNNNEIVFCDNLQELQPKTFKNINKNYRIINENNYIIYEKKINDTDPFIYFKLLYNFKIQEINIKDETILIENTSKLPNPKNIAQINSDFSIYLTYLLNNNLYTRILYGNIINSNKMILEKLLSMTMLGNLDPHINTINIINSMAFLNIVLEYLNYMSDLNKTLVDSKTFPDPSYNNTDILLEFKKDESNFDHKIYYEKYLKEDFISFFSTTDDLSTTLLKISNIYSEYKQLYKILKPYICSDKLYSVEKGKRENLNSTVFEYNEKILLFEKLKNQNNNIYQYGIKNFDTIFYLKKISIKDIIAKLPNLTIKDKINKKFKFILNKLENDVPDITIFNIYLDAKLYKNKYDANYSKILYALFKICMKHKILEISNDELYLSNFINLINEKKLINNSLIEKYFDNRKYIEDGYNYILICKLLPLLMKENYVLSSSLNKINKILKSDRQYVWNKFLDDIGELTDICLLHNYYENISEGKSNFKFYENIIIDYVLKICNNNVKFMPINKYNLLNKLIFKTVTHDPDNYYNETTISQLQPINLGSTRFTTDKQKTLYFDKIIYKQDANLNGYKIIPFGYDIKISEYPTIPWANCVETALLNLISYVFWNRDEGRFNVEYLDNYILDNVDLTSRELYDVLKGFYKVIDEENLNNKNFFINTFSNRKITQYWNGTIFANRTYLNYAYPGQKRAEMESTLNNTRIVFEKFFGKKVKPDGTDFYDNSDASNKEAIIEILRRFPHLKTSNINWVLNPIFKGGRYNHGLDINNEFRFLLADRHGDNQLLTETDDVPRYRLLKYMTESTTTGYAFDLKTNKYYFGFTNFMRDIYSTSISKNVFWLLLNINIDSLTNSYSNVIDYFSQKSDTSSEVFLYLFKNIYNYDLLKTINNVSVEDCLHHIYQHLKVNLLEKTDFIKNIFANILIFSKKNKLIKDTIIDSYLMPISRICKTNNWDMYEINIIKNINYINKISYGNIKTMLEKKIQNNKLLLQFSDFEDFIDFLYSKMITEKLPIYIEIPVMGKEYNYDLIKSKILFYKELLEIIYLLLNNIYQIDDNSYWTNTTNLRIVRLQYYFGIPGVYAKYYEAQPTLLFKLIDIIFGFLIILEKAIRNKSYKLTADNFKDLKLELSELINIVKNIINKIILKQIVVYKTTTNLDINFCNLILYIESINDYLEYTGYNHISKSKESFIYPKTKKCIENIRIIISDMLNNNNFLRTLIIDNFYSFDNTKEIKSNKGINYKENDYIFDKLVNIYNFDLTTINKTGNTLVENYWNHPNIGVDIKDEQKQKFYFLINNKTNKLYLLEYYKQFEVWLTDILLLKNTTNENKEFNNNLINYLNIINTNNDKDIDKLIDVIKLN